MLLRHGGLFVGFFALWLYDYRVTEEEILRTFERGQRRLEWERQQAKQNPKGRLSDTTHAQSSP